MTEICTFKLLDIDENRGGKRPMTAYSREARAIKIKTVKIVLNPALLFIIVFDPHISL